MNLLTSGYFISAGLFAILEIMLITHWRGRRQGGLLLLIVAVIIAWNFACAMAGYQQRFFFRSVIFLEVLRDTLIFMFLFSLLGPVHQSRWQQLQLRFFKILVYLISMVVLVGTTYINYDITLHEYTFIIDYNIVLASVLLMATLGLSTLVVLYGNTLPDARQTLKFLFWGVSLLFAMDFLLYSSAMLYGHVDKELWAGRGYLAMLAVPLLTLSAQRNPSWSIDVFVSKQLVFHATTLVSVGIYLFLTAIIGYYIQVYGGYWRTTALVIFLSLALGVLVFALYSSTLRARVKVLINKHFFNYKYDYREEWTRLTQDLSRANEENGLYVTVITSMASLVKSRGGMLWLLNDNKTQYHVVAQTLDTDASLIEPVDSEFVRFLFEKDWIIDLGELQQYPERYQHLGIPDWLAQVDDAWLVIPLQHRDDLYGFVVLARSSIMQNLNWEDRDLLKTAGMQAVSYLAFQEASDSLARTEKFAVFHRLSAFVVHDLKNLVAQLDLITRNAEKFKHNPEFVDDAFETVQHATTKMGRLLTQLKQGRFSAQVAGNIDVQDAMQEIVKNHNTYLPIPQLHCNLNNVRITANHDRFISVVGHIIKNAQEATEDDGYVRVDVTFDNDMLTIEVADNGCGMDETFIKEKLYTPFFTTKGNAGMGVGVYECREFFESLGGQVDVTSIPGEGTVFKLKVPAFTGSLEQVGA